jgi:hypothetical protein
MKSCYYYSLIIGLLIIVCTINAQTWHVYTDNDSGLPNNTVNDIAIDSNGIKWMATAGGLAKFDGEEWTTFHTTNSGIPSNTVRSLAIDSMGQIWIGTNSGLAVYNGYGQGNNGWAVYNMTNSPLPRNVVNALAIDSQDKVWIGTLGGGGLASLQGTEWSVFTTGNSDLPNNFIYSLAVTSDNSIWIGTNFGLALYDGALWTIYYTNNSSLPDDPIRSLAIDNEDILFVGTLDGGMAKFEDVTWTVYNQFNSPLPSNSVSALLAKNNDLIWIGTENNGLALMNFTGWTTYFTYNSPLISDQILSLAVDNENIKWIGTDSGLMSYDYVSVSSLSIVPAQLVIPENETFQLTLQILPDNATNQEVIWHSSNADIADVDQTGLLTAISAGNVTITAISDDGNRTATCFVEVTGTVQPPVFSPPAGTYEDEVFVEISTDPEDATIHYTLDGSDPDQNSPVYVNPIHLNETTLVKAIAYKEQWEASSITEADYVIAVSVEDDTLVQPLISNLTIYPNPISKQSSLLRQNSGEHSTMEIMFFLSEPQELTLILYDIKGRIVNRYPVRKTHPGHNTFSFSVIDVRGKSLSPGIYLFQLQNDKISLPGKFTVIE